MDKQARTAIAIMLATFAAMALTAWAMTTFTPPRTSMENDTNFHHTPRPPGIPSR